MSLKFHRSPQGALKTPPRPSQDDPRSCKISMRLSQKRPKSPEDLPKTSQDLPETLPRPFKTLSKVSQQPIKTPQDLRSLHSGCKAPSCRGRRQSAKPVNLTSRGKRKAQIEEDDLALLNNVCRNLFFNRCRKRCGAGHGGACWGPLRGGTRWSALGNAAGRDTMDRAVEKSKEK